MAKVLTDAMCKAAKPVAGKRTEMFDSRCAGLALRVTAAGIKSWNFRFRDPRKGPTAGPSRIMIGRYPDVSLADARVKATQYRETVAAGQNPIELKAQERVEAPARTFQHLADRYLTEHAKRHKRPRSVVEDERNLKKHVLPKWAKRDYRDIKRRDAIALIEGIVSAGTHTAANRVHQLISKIFSFAMDADLIDANPVARLKKRGKETTGKRVLDDAEIALFWHGIVKPPVSPLVGNALRLALVTASRANEISGIEIAELSDLDGTSPGLLFSEDRVKNKRAHFVPLTPLAVEVVKATLPSDKSARHLFPSKRGASGRVSAHALAVAMSRFCESLEGEGAAKSLKDNPASPHDLRRTAATRMSALGVPREDRDAVLNHARTDVGKHYDLYERADEKRNALERFAALVERCVADTSKLRST